jgi:hypothetical protein
MNFAERPQTIKIFCHYPASASAYEADVVCDITCDEVATGLIEDGYLPALRPGERYRIILRRSDRELAPSDTLATVGTVDRDEFEILLDTHGAGPPLVELAEVLAAAKVAVDAARVVVDAYRARTERMSLELKRELEAQVHRDPDSTKEDRPMRMTGSD